MSGILAGAAYANPSVILGVVFLLVMLGMLVPRRNLRDMQQDRDYWRAAWTQEVAAHAVTREQLGEALEQGRTTNQIIQRAHAAAADGSSPARRAPRSS